MTQHRLRNPLATGSTQTQRGFTLLEVMVVIVILGIMAAFIAPNIFGRVDKARQQKAISDIKTMSAALDMYQLDNFNYPSTDQGLEALLTAPSPDMPNYQSGGYLKKGNMQDPWNRPYYYASPGDHGGDFDIFSYGRDGQPGGEGPDKDIVSWE